jgi:hypothetical protein
LCLIKFEEARDSKMIGRVVATTEDAKGVTGVQNLSVGPGVLRFGLQVGGQTWAFEGKLPAAEGKRVLGSLDLGGRGLMPARLEATTLQSFDPFDVSREILAQQPTDGQLFTATLVVLNRAGAKKLEAKEVRAHAERAFKVAETYGPRWQREIALRVAEALASQDGLAPIAVEFARRAERSLAADADVALRSRVLGLLATALRHTDKTAEAQEIGARIDAMELTAFKEHAKRALPFKPDTFPGRKVKSDRVILVELFTCAHAGPSVASDLAFDALEKTYKPTDVVLLEYHIESPRFDPLANLDGDARRRYYSDSVEAAPTIFFSGKLQPGGGGFAADADERYKDFRDGIELQMEDPSKAKLRATAVQKGNQIAITAEVSDLQEPGERTRLRLALVEDWVRYQGDNRLRYHHHIVRAMPGGVPGLPLKEKTGKQTVTVDLDEVRRNQERYLDSRRFHDDRPPVSLRRLRVVAFVQNDQTKQVLQAVQVDVRPEGGAAKE